MYITQLISSLKPTRREHWLMLVLLLYAITKVLRVYLPAPICNAISVLCSITFIAVIIGHIRGIQLKGLTGISYAIVILWSVLLTIRMIFIDDVRGTFEEYHGITTWVLAFFDSNYLMPNLIPFVVLIFPRGYRFDFNYLWRIMWLLCILYLCYYPFAFWSMTHYSWSFEEAAGTVWGDAGTYGDFISHSTLGIANLAPVVIMVYFKKYMSAKRWQWFLTTYLGSIVLTIFLARRGGLATSLLYLALAWLMYSFFDKRTSKFSMILVAIVTVGLGYMLFTGMSDTLFATLLDRGMEDSRSGVEESFYADMKSINDWMFGRGWFGQYYEALQGNYRSSIETGYLALILRGGFLYLIPYVLTLALTFVNGLFRSRNLFCKSFAIMALMQIVSLYPSGWPAFNFFHFILWVGVWVCNSTSFRKLSDNQVNELYFARI